MLGDGFDHEVGRVADIGDRAHEHRPGRNRHQRGDMGHELRRVAPRQIEKHQIGRGVVEKGRQRPGEPEVRGRDGLTLRIGSKRDQPGQRSAAARPQDGDDRNDGEKNAEN